MLFTKILGILAVIAALCCIALVAMQVMELNFYAAAPSVWPTVR
jgi:hypothetical protein